MTTPRLAFEQRVFEMLESPERRIPVVTGADGTGRSDLLLRLGALFGEGRARYADFERIAATPEHFLRQLVGAGELTDASTATPSAAFACALDYLQRARAADGGPLTFLLDEVLELRTFENFPGLRLAVREFFTAIGDSQNHFVLTTRYPCRAARYLKDAGGRFELLPITPLSVEDVRDHLTNDFHHASLSPDLATTIQRLADGRDAYVRAIVRSLVNLTRQGASDPLSALVALLAPGGELDAWCHFCYELRLHRARGYGALKAILAVLAEEEPLTLTAISLRLGRTPGSTKDYLSWLEDVDLVSVQRKRYRFADPVLRLWVRLNGARQAPSESRLAREVHAYAAARLPQAPGAQPAPSASPAVAGHRSSAIIEID